MSYYPQPTQQKQEPNRQQFWWCYGQTQLGKTLLLGAFNSEEQANQMAYAKFDGEFQVVQLPTRDVARATQILKFRKMQGGESADASMQRFRHGQENSW